MTLETKLKNTALVTARKSLAMTQEAIAARVGISTAIYNQYENNTAYPRPQTQTRICNMYRQAGVFLFEEDVFPQTLQQVSIRNNTSSDAHDQPLTSFEAINAPLLQSTEKNMEQMLCHNEGIEQLYAAMNRLKPQQQTVLRQYFGLDDEPRTMNEIASKLGVSEKRILHVYHRAISTLRHRFKAENYFTTGHELDSE